MTYTEAKLEAFEKLLPKKGDRYIEQGSRVFEVSSTPGVGWVDFVYTYPPASSGGGTTKLAECWRRLNLGIWVRTRL